MRCSEYGPTKAQCNAVIEALYPVLLGLASFIASWTGDPVATGQDALQTALMRVLARWKAYPQEMAAFLAQSPAAQAAFFLAAIRNNTLQIARGEKWLQPLPERERAGEAVPDITEIVEWEDYYAKALQTLPPRQREVVALARKGFSVIETAEALGITPNNVRQQRLKAGKNGEKFLRQDITRKSKPPALPVDSQSLTG